MNETSRTVKGSPWIQYRINPAKTAAENVEKSNRPPKVCTDCAAEGRHQVAHYENGQCRWHLKNLPHPATLAKAKAVHA